MNSTIFPFYRMIGTRTKGKFMETRCAPSSIVGWYKFISPEKMLSAMKKNHPEWNWRIEFKSGSDDSR